MLSTYRPLSFIPRTYLCHPIHMLFSRLGPNLPPALHRFIDKPLPMSATPHPEPLKARARMSKASHRRQIHPNFTQLNQLWLLSSLLNNAPPQARRSKHGIAAQPHSQLAPYMSASRPPFGTTRSTCTGLFDPLST